MRTVKRVELDGGAIWAEVHEDNRVWLTTPWGGVWIEKPRDLVTAFTLMGYALERLRHERECGLRDAAYQEGWWNAVWLNEEPEIDQAAHE